MNDEKKIVILDGVYNEEKKIVKLHIKYPDTGQPLTLAIAADQFAPAFGVNVDLTKYDGLVDKFIEMLRGKEKKWISTPEMTEDITKDMKDASNSDILKAHSHFDGYPFREILEEIQEES